MILDYIRKIIKKQQEQGSNLLYIRSTIKEYLQIIVLSYLYTHKQYKDNLIFTGGTCLRHFFNLERLSEDLDFDSTVSTDTKGIADDMYRFFKSSLQYPDLSIAVKQHGKQILLKFPILTKLNLAQKSESDYVYIKCDIEKIAGKNYTVLKTSKSIFGYNFVARHFDLPSLMAGKTAAIINRNLLSGTENREIIKGRDFYDFLWFIKMGVKINYKFLKDKLQNRDITSENLRTIISQRITEAVTKYKNDFKNDLLPFISDPRFLDDYIENYKNEFDRLRIDFV